MTLPGQLRAARFPDVEVRGLVRVGLLAVDGMKLHANASQHANRDYQRIAEEWLTW